MRRYKPLRATRYASRRPHGQRDRNDERADVEIARRRAKGRCEVSVGRRCTRQDRETHHVIKRSQGGKFRGADYLMRVCRDCHGMMDVAVTAKTTLLDGSVHRGQLKAVALGDGRFRCWMETVEKSVSRETVGRR